jgi:guanylate kinase
MNTGNLYVVAAPSGAGKTSLVKCLVETTPGVTISISYTTRSPRLGEKDGVHYRFISNTAFESMRVNGVFLEHAEVFGNCYGTSYSNILMQLDSDLDVILEIDWQGARQVREIIPDSKTIFILPPSLEELRQRLSKRDQDGIETIEERMATASSELSHYKEFDYLVVNEQFSSALEALRAIIIANRQRRKTQERRQHSLLHVLLS